MLHDVNESADPDEVLAHIRRMPLEERHRIAAALVEELDRDFDAADVRAEIMARAEQAVAHPEERISAAQVSADMRAAAAAIRSSRK